MADKPTNRERLQEITAGIEQGIKELFESEKYMRCLLYTSLFIHLQETFFVKTVCLNLT